MTKCPNVHGLWGEPCDARYPRMPRPEVTEVLCRQKKKTVKSETCKLCRIRKPTKQADLVSDFGFPDVPKKLKIHGDEK